MTAEVNFVRQQGFRDASSATCAYQYPALMWQPRAIGGLVLIGLVVQAWPYFLVLSALLWWNVAVPSLNPFDALYGYLVAKPKGAPRLGPAPSPRRFAQAMAGTFMLTIGLALFAHWRALAWAFEAVLVAALGALVFARSCLGSPLIATDACFWRDLMSERPTSPGAALVAGGSGWLVGIYSITEDARAWEMHPSGDELLTTLAGGMDVVLGRAGREVTPTLELEFHPIGTVVNGVREAVDSGWAEGGLRGLLARDHRPGQASPGSLGHAAGRHLRSAGATSANPIGVTTVAIDRLAEDSVYVRGLDAIDGTRVLGIKPHVRAFDSPPEATEPEWMGRLQSGCF
jgi:hypothetical protein